MQLQILASGDYPFDELDKLLAEIRSDGVQVTRSGIYGRRSLESLPPALWLIVSFAAGAIGTGFLHAMGADAWEALKRQVQRSESRQGHAIAPTVTLELKLEDFQVILRPLSSADNTFDALDEALERLEQGERNEDLYYDRDSDKWFTLDERLTLKIRWNRFSSSDTWID